MACVCEAGKAGERDCVPSIMGCGMSADFPRLLKKRKLSGKIFILQSWNMEFPPHKFLIRAVKCFFKLFLNIGL